jgi:predicted Zn-dependent protease
MAFHPFFELISPLRGFLIPLANEKMIAWQRNLKHEYLKEIVMEKECTVNTQKVNEVELGSNVVSINEGIRAFDNKHYSRAIGHLLNVVHEEPDNWKARLLLARACQADNLTKQANIEFTYIMRMCPDEETRKQALALQTRKDFFKDLA